MRDKRILDAMHVVLAVVFGSLCLSAAVLAQERRPLKDFGSTLSQNSASSKGGKEGPKSTIDDDVVRVQTDLVVSEVLVLDQQGRSIKGLARDDFVIREDDTAQVVGPFSLGHSTAVPRSIVLIIDYS